MNLAVENVAVSGGNLLDLIFAEIEFFTLGSTVSSGRNGIDHFALHITNRTVQGNNILSSADLKDSAFQCCFAVNRLINTFVHGDVNERLAGLCDIHNTLLRHVALVDLDNGNTVLGLGIFFRYIKINRGSVQNITIRSFHLYKEVSLAVRKLLRGYESTVFISVEGINRGRRRIGEGHRHQLTVRIEDLKSCTGVRNSLIGFCINLYHVDKALEIAVVDQITISGLVLRNVDIKVGHQLASFPATNLVNGISAVREHFGLTKSMLIANDNVSFGVCGVFITTCRLQEDLKRSANFGSLDLSAAVVRVLNNGNVAVDDILVYIRIEGVQLDREIAGLCVHIIDGIVQQISFGGADLADCPVVVTDIVVGEEITVLVGSVGVNQFLALEDTVNCAAERCVTLRISVRITKRFNRLFRSFRQSHRHQRHRRQRHRYQTAVLVIIVVSSCQLGV